MNKKGMVPLPMIFLILIAIVVAGFFLVPAEYRIMIPIGVIAFIIGVIPIFENHLTIIIIGSLYWIFYDLMDNLNLTQNPVVAAIFSPIVMVALISFLIGKFFGKMILGVLGIGG